MSFTTRAINCINSNITVKNMAGELIWATIHSSYNPEFNLQIFNYKNTHIACAIYTNNGLLTMKIPNNSIVTFNKPIGLIRVRDHSLYFKNIAGINKISIDETRWNIPKNYKALIPHNPNKFHVIP